MLKSQGIVDKFRMKFSFLQITSKVYSIFRNVYEDETDNVFVEARAALEGGMGCLLVDRPGNAPLSEQDRKIAPIITSFDQMDSYLHSKRL